VTTGEATADSDVMRYCRRTTAFLIADRRCDAGPAMAALILQGVRLLARSSLENGRLALRECALPDLLIVVLGDDAETGAIPVLDLLAGLLAEHRLEVLVGCPPDQIDLVCSFLLGGSVQVLSDPGAADWEAAVAAAVNRRSGNLHDPAGEEERKRLRELQDRIGSIADNLADLVSRVKAAGPGANGELPLAKEPDALTEAAGIRRMSRGRQLRSQFFSGGLFADPAWDILLELYASRLEDVKVSVSKLCAASGVPATTALRWIGLLQYNGLIERHPDTLDRRRCSVRLADGAHAMMWEYFRAVRGRGYLTN